MSSYNANSMITALAVLVAIVAVFFAGLMYGKSKITPVAVQPEPAAAPPGVTPDLTLLRVRDTDAVRGDGAVLLIEYSDYECPFCQRFHATAQALVDSGEVTWVYRHLPLPFHPTAEDGAVIAECVKIHRGLDAFWSYTDRVFALQDGFSVEIYTSLAQGVGLSASQVDACLAADSDARAVVRQHMSDAEKMGVNGTPGSFLVNTRTKAVESIPGALPLEQIRAKLATIQ